MSKSNVITQSAYSTHFGVKERHYHLIRGQCHWPRLIQYCCSLTPKWVEFYNSNCVIMFSIRYVRLMNVKRRKHLVTERGWYPLPVCIPTAPECVRMWRHRSRTSEKRKSERTQSEQPSPSSSPGREAPRNREHFWSTRHLGIFKCEQRDGYYL